MTAIMHHRAPLTADSLALGGFDRKRSFDQRLDLDQQTLDLNRSISKLIDDDDSDLAELSTKSLGEKATAPAETRKLTRGHTIGATGFNHLLYDIHATHGLDLHSAVTSPGAEAARMDKHDEEVDSPAKWLQKVTWERSQRPVSFAAEPAVSVATPTPAPSAEPAADKAQKQWALLRTTSLLLSALNAAKAAQAEARSPSASPPRAQFRPPLPAFDVQAFVEQTFLQQAQAGELNDLFATLGGAYNDGQAIMQLQLQLQQQQLLYEQQQQQQYFMQLQQQQQLHLQQMQQLHQTPQYAQHTTPFMATPRSPPSPPAAPPSAALPVTAGRLVEMALSKEGSLTLQKALHSMSPAKLQEACDELAPHIGALSVDTFGNYLVSSIAKLPQAQPAIVAALTGRVAELSVHPQGSRVVQAALEALPTATASGLASELAGQVARVSVQVCGSWSVVAAYKATHASFILAEVAAAVGYLSTLQDGSRVVQRVIPEAASHGADVSGVINALIGLGHGLCRLAADPYGNYVVQKALNHSDGKRRHQLIDLLLPSLPTLSSSKAGSNAAEALLAHVSAERFPDARRALLFECPVNLTTDRFGKHVIAALSRRAATLGVAI